MYRNSKIPSNQSFVGIQYGYVVLPSDVDRDKFIEQCYRQERVSIYIEGGAGYNHECYITRSAIADVEFPATPKQLGSCVAFITDLFSNTPIIFGVLSKEDESQMLREGMFKVSKNYQDAVVTLSGDAKKGIINVSVSGGSMTQINISASNANKDAILNLRSQGIINIEATDTMNLNITSDVTLTTKGTVNVISEGDITVDTKGKANVTSEDDVTVESKKSIFLNMDKKLKINNGNEAMVKGTTLATEITKSNLVLTALKTIIGGAPIPEPGNGSPSAFQAALAVAIAALQLGDFTGIKSEKSFLD